MILEKVKDFFNFNKNQYVLHFVVCFFIMYIFLFLFSLVTASVNFERLFDSIFEFIQYTFELGKFDKSLLK